MRDRTRDIPPNTGVQSARGSTGSSPIPHTHPGAILFPKLRGSGRGALVTSAAVARSPAHRPSGPRPAAHRPPAPPTGGPPHERRRVTLDTRAPSPARAYCPSPSLRRGPRRTRRPEPPPGGGATKTVAAPPPPSG